MKALIKKSIRGFTLIETIVTLAILVIISLICIGILSSAFTARNFSDEAIKEQVALRQAVLAVTSEIRKAPDDAGPLGPLDERYEVADGMLKRATGDYAGSVIAKDIADFNIDTGTEPGRALINITSTNGTTVETQIYIRVFTGV